MLNHNDPKDQRFIKEAAKLAILRMGCNKEQFIKITEEKIDADMAEMKKNLMKQVALAFDEVKSQLTPFGSKH